MFIFGKRRENQIDNESRHIDAILGHIVADALGVPVEFKSRFQLKEDPVKDMMGYGTHSQPAGTWSDDTSMTVATLEWLGERQDATPDYNSLMDKFCAWLLYGDYTPYGTNFDNGIATAKALMNYGCGVVPLECGCKGDFDNGNGSLMRILPAALYKSKALAAPLDLDTEKFEEAVQFIYDISSLTHAHARSKVGCFIYAKVIADMLYELGMFAETQGDGIADKFAIVQSSLLTCKTYLENIPDEEFTREKETYVRLWDLQAFKNLPEEAIQSSGYVLHTLEAAIWCFLNTDNYKECVLKAVNLGDDTDTVGAVAGGLAGLYYGLDDIPKDWLELIPKREWIVELTENMTKSLEN